MAGWGISGEERQASLLFFRRNLAEKLALEMLRQEKCSWDRIAERSTQIAEAVTARLDAMEIPE